MKIELSTKPKKPKIIVGFPGIGLVGPIVTEFLVGHMETKQIGYFTYDELPATAAIHKGKLVHPMSIHYSKKYNTLIIYTILNLQGFEWKVAEQIVKLADDLKSDEIICVDGANTIGDEGSDIYAFNNPRMEKDGAKPLDESVITGVPGALLLTTEKIMCLFAGTNAKTPDSKAAASVVQMLDKHLNMDIDPKPLMEQAKVFEEKLKSVMDQSKRVLSDQERKKMDYLG